jgi:WD40 repeat protein
LDKTLIQTTIQGCDLDGTTRHTQRLEVPGAPVFSLTRAQPLATGGADSPKKQHPPRPSVWAGLAAKDIVSWDPAAGALNSKVRMNGHTGWVRSLATSGKWLFSCGCNHLRQWDTTLAVPKEVHRETLATGDILRIATGGGRVFTAGADGSLRSWLLPKAGHMQPGISREKAHEGQRVTALAYHAGMVYTVSYDGMIKAWDAESLNLVMEVRAAHDGARIQCATIGSDGYLYTGGDDALVRRWDVVELSPASEPLHVHGSSVRVLAAGSKDCLLSGDASGEVAVWSL